MTGNPARDPMSPLRPVVAWTLCLVCLTCTEDSTRSGPTGPSRPRGATVAPTGPVLVGAGDIARCDGQGDEATAALLDGIPGTVFTAGNNVYGSDSVTPDFTNCYGPSWGRFKARTRPAVGSHEYYSPGAATYWQYFGAAAGDSGAGYYSYELGSWHIIVLNSGVDMRVASPQEQWLRADLAAHPALCTLAYWHHPRFSSVPNSAGVKVLPQIKPLWDDLYAAGAEVVINAHYEVYERFAPQTPDGAADPPRGIRQFTVGTGGMDVQRFPLAALANSEVRNSGTAGVLQLTLSDGGYSWQFVPVAGETFTDSGNGSCHDTSPPTPVGSVDVSPSSASFEVGARIHLTAVARDASGAPLGERVTTWTSSDPSVARVTSRGVVTAWAPGSATITATVEGKQGAAAITATPSSAAILVGAGDIATCKGVYDEQTAALLDDIPGTVFTVGDNVYDNGTATEYTDCYDPSWGRHKARTRPTPGNHDYYTPGATGYFGYFGAAAGDPTLGYYSYDLGAWHIVVLNNYQTMTAGSTQEQWLRADLAAHPSQCTLAMWHEPLFSSGMTHGGNLRTQPLWQALYDAGAEVVVTGHDHSYQRFAPQTTTGVADAAYGIREFVVGTGGAGLEEFVSEVPNTEARNNSAHGVLKLTLRESSYEWEFIPDLGQTFADSGGAPCHGVPGAPVNTPPQASFSAACSGLNCAFTNTSHDADGTVVASRWTFGDGATSTEQSPSHTYAASGSYSVGLTVTDDGGANGSTANTVTVTQPVNTPPQASFSAACSGLNCAFTNTSHDPDGTVVASRWTFGDGATSTDPNPSHRYAASGGYSVGLTVTDDGGATGATTNTVTVRQPPVASAGGPYRSEDQVTVDGRGSYSPDGSTPLTYSWSFGDGGTGSGVAPTHSYAADGTYTITLVVTDATGAASDPATATATIANIPPTVDAGPDANMMPGSFTLRARFSDPGANDAPWRYTISWGDGASQSGSTSSQSDPITASHLYVLPATYRVRVTVTDKDGGVGTDDLLVTVRLTP